MKAAIKNDQAHPTISTSHCIIENIFRPFNSSTAHPPIMEDTNVRIQAYLQTKKQIIFDLHVNQKRSINEVHRELVHHQDPWFT